MRCQSQGAGGRPGLAFLENPDGSLILGLRPGLKIPAPSIPFAADGQGLPHSAREALELESGLQRHRRVFSCLILAELAAEVAFNVALVSRARHSVQEVALIYDALPIQSLWYIFWGMLACEISYLKVYYGFAFMAISRDRVRAYRWFVHAALVGVLGQVLFAYMNKFNVLLLLMRLGSYVYAKILQKRLEFMRLSAVSTDSV